MYNLRLYLPYSQEKKILLSYRQLANLKSKIKETKN